MAEKKASIWTSGLWINLVSNLISLAVGGFVTYLQHDGSAWVKPLLCGAAAWLITFISLLAIRFMRRMPPRVEPITHENVGRKIRDWLDDLNLTVKSISEPETYFSFVVTTDGGKKVGIFRSAKLYTQYIEFRSYLNQTEEEKKLLVDWSEDEKVATVTAMQLELSRAVMGYKFEDGFAKLSIFKRVPITPSLTAEEVYNALWEVEAMIGSIYAVATLAAQRHKMAHV